MTSMIVDANALYARSWFAAQRERPDEPIEAITLMFRTILLLLNPNINKIGVPFDATLFAWDAKQNQMKNRTPKPEKYNETKSVVLDTLEFIFNAVCYEHPDFEGDDIVATAAYAATQSKPNDTVYVISSDKDLQQLQGAGIHYYCLNTKTELSTSYIKMKHYVARPDHLALALAIIGDPVDNIKGVRGWGLAKWKALAKNLTNEMDVDIAAKALILKMNKFQEDEFQASFQRTLLKRNVPGVPPPARLQLASPAKVRALGIPGINTLYAQVWEAYETKN